MANDYIKLNIKYEHTAPVGYEIKVNDKIYLVKELTVKEAVKKALTRWGNDYL